MSDWFLSIAWYGSFGAAVVGVVTLVRPVPRLHLGSRAHGAVLLALASLVILVNGSAAPTATTIHPPLTAHDAVQPDFHFREVHARDIAAAPARIRQAVAQVTANDIALFRAFTTIRRFGRPGPESILNAPNDLPILEVATRTTFVTMVRSEREVVIGTLLSAPHGQTLDPGDPHAFQRLSGPGLITASLSFRVLPTGPSSARLVTETRVHASDRRALQRFTWYWRTIFPGSWILRVTWLRAIAARATER
jgi:hypothetical protein